MPDAPKTDAPKTDEAPLPDRFSAEEEDIIFTPADDVEEDEEDPDSDEA